MAVLIGGHRGMGCTDHEFYLEHRDVSELPAENSADSISLAFKNGADFVEVDAVCSNDGISFVIHNVDPQDHFFGEEAPSTYLNNLEWAEIKRFRTGRYQQSDPSNLRTILEIVKQNKKESNQSFWINVELKGTQGTSQAADEDRFFDSIRDVVAATGLREEDVLFSSFSVDSIARMSKRLPKSKYGVLFSERKELRDIYLDGRGLRGFQYLPFDSQSISFAIQYFRDNGSSVAILDYLHPEITTVSTEMLRQCWQVGWKINLWALFEVMTPERRESYRDIIIAALQDGADLGIITDYLDDFCWVKDVRLRRSIS